MPVLDRKKQIRWSYLFVFSLLFSMAVTACSTNGVRNENAETDNTLSKASTQTDRGFKVKINYTPGCPGNTDKSFLYTGNIEDIF